MNPRHLLIQTAETSLDGFTHLGGETDNTASRILDARTSSPDRSMTCLSSHLSGSTFFVPTVP
jgi:hypothetical protein